MLHGIVHPLVVGQANRREATLARSRCLQAYTRLQVYLTTTFLNKGVSGTGSNHEKDDKSYCGMFNENQVFHIEKFVIPDGVSQSASHEKSKALGSSMSDRRNAVSSRLGIG